MERNFFLLTAPVNRNVCPTVARIRSLSSDTIGDRMSALATQTIVQPSSSVKTPAPLDSALHAFGLEPVMQRAAPLLAILAEPRRPLGRRTAGRHHPRIRIHPADGVSGPRERRTSSQGGQLSHPQGTTRRRRLEQLPRRAGRSQRLRQGVFRPEARRPCRRRSAHATSPRRDPRTGRRGAVQQLHQVLPRVPRASSLTTTAPPCRRR